MRVYWRPTAETPPAFLRIKYFIHFIVHLVVDSKSFFILILSECRSDNAGSLLSSLRCDLLLGCQCFKAVITLRWTRVKLQFTKKSPKAFIESASCARRVINPSLWSYQQTDLKRSPLEFFWHMSLQKRIIRANKILIYFINWWSC